MTGLNSMTMAAWLSIGGLQAIGLGPTPRPAVMPDMPVDEIVVTGIREPFVLDGTTLNRILDAFYARRAAAAPQARLYYQFEKAGGAPVNFALNGRDTMIALPRVAENLAVFPLDKPGNGPFRMIANASRKQVSGSFQVMSPGTTTARRRLGDLRLQCEVMWTAKASPVLRTLIPASRGCRSSSIGIYLRSPARITAATVRYDGHVAPVSIKDGMAYRPPLWDKNIPDSAIIELHFD